MPTVTIPGIAKPFTQLGFGSSYVRDRGKALRQLDAAYEAGIRHFDTARLYGQGKTEALVGEFLRRHPDATVTTKYGLNPPNFAQRVVEALQRRVPAFQRRTAWLKRNERADFTGADARKSLERSLRLLGRDHIDLFLLHEPWVSDLVHDDLIALLEAQREAGKIGNFGIGGEYFLMPQLLRERPRYAQVLQFERSIFGPNLDLPGTCQIHYRTFARAAKALGKRFAADPALAARWSSRVDADLAEPQVAARLILKAGLDQHPNTMVLFSTGSEEHIFANVAVALDASLSSPARRLAALIREDDLGIGRELYG